MALQRPIATDRTISSSSRAENADSTAKHDRSPAVNLRRIQARQRGGRGYAPSLRIQPVLNPLTPASRLVAISPQFTESLLQVCYAIALVERCLRSLLSKLPNSVVGAKYLVMNQQVGMGEPDFFTCYQLAHISVEFRS